MQYKNRTGETLDDVCPVDLVQSQTELTIFTFFRVRTIRFCLDICLVRICALL